MKTAKELAEEAWGHPYQSQAQRSALLRAVGAADAEGDLDYAFELRTRYINAAYGSGDSSQTIAAFGWCLARHDEDPKRFNLNLWYYKWVVSAALASATVDRHRLKDLIDDMERRYAERNSSLAPVLNFRISYARRFAPSEVRSALEALLDSDRTSRKGLNDCNACVASAEAGHWQYLGKHSKALEVAAPVLEEQMTCSRQPHHLLGRMIESCRAVGDHKSAAEYHRRGLDKIANFPISDFADAHGNHLRHVAITTAHSGDTSELLKRLKAAQLTERVDDAERFQYLRGVRLASKALVATGIDADEIAEAAGDAEQDALELAEAFDASNGNAQSIDRLAAEEAELAGLAAG